MKVLRMVNQDLAQQWATRINRYADTALEQILAMGRDLAAAKKALHHGGWLRLFADHPECVAEPLRFSRRTATRLMVIARHPVLSNGTHGSHLPCSWRTLYELSRLPDATLRRALGEGRITPELERRDVAALRGTPQPPRGQPAGWTVEAAIRRLETAIDREVAAAPSAADRRLIGGALRQRAHFLEKAT